MGLGPAPRNSNLMGVRLNPGGSVGVLGKGPGRFYLRPGFRTTTISLIPRDSPRQGLDQSASHSIHIQGLYCKFQGATYPFSPGVFLKLHGPLGGSCKDFCYMQNITFMGSVLHMEVEPTINYQHAIYASEQTISQRHFLLS